MRSSARAFGWVVASTIMVGLAACTGGPAHAPVTTAISSAPVDGPVGPSSAPVSDSVLRCEDAIDTEAPPASYRVVLGVVALPVSPAHPALETSISGDGTGPWRLFAKTGLMIRSRTSFELVVPTQPGVRLGIGWGSPATPRQRVVVSGCPEASRTGWLSYPGGYWIDHPACAAVIVEAGDKQQLVQIGIGTACAGQRPPQGVSQS